jgi:outer membrane receptor for ferrienterochelin and colicins
MRNFLFVLGLQLCCGVAWAQQNGILKGVVYGGGDNLGFASVSLLHTSFAANADTNGHFTIKDIPAGKYQLRVTYVGFENYQDEITIVAGQQTVAGIKLIPLNSKLREVVVTGALKEVTKLESVTPVEVYTTKYFQRNPVSNLHEALSNVPGIFPDIDNGVSNTSDIQINGLEGNYTMFLIDGVPALNGLAGMYALNAFPIGVVDKIEILKGASSSLYGSEAIAGVINIKTKNPLNAPRFTMNASLTSMLEADADFAVRYKLGKAESMLAVSGETFNQRWDINGDGFLDIPLINRINIYNKWSIPRPENRIADFYVRYLFEDRFGGETSVPSQWRGSTRQYGEAITTHQWQMGYQYQVPVKDNVLWISDYSEHRQHAYFGSHVYDGMQVSGFSQLTWSKKIDDISGFVFGIAYRVNYLEDNSPLSTDSLTGYARTIHIPGLFFEDELSFAKYHKLLLGARIESNSRTGFAFTPRINYKWNSKDMNNILRIGAGTGYRAPNVLNEGFAALNGSRTILVKGPLKPESAVTGTINYTRVQQFNGGFLNLDASVFYTYFLNFINANYDEDPSLIVYENHSGATAAGFSINADLTFNFPLKVGVGVTYTNVYQVEEDSKGNEVKEVPTHQPPVTANFYLSYNFPVPQLSIDWTGNFVSPMKLATVPNDYRPDKSPFYTIQNIQVTKKFHKGVEIYLGLKNIFNFIQKDPILRPFDPFNRFTTIDNPYNYHFDTTYGFTSTQGIKAFIGFRYTLQ